MLLIILNRINMIFVDNYYYYLFVWFKQRQKKFKNSEPGERVSYGIGLIIEIWIYTLITTIEFVITKTVDSSISILFYVISGLFFMWLINYIYIKKGRLDVVIKKKKPFSDKTGILISIIFSFLSIIIPLVLFWLL